VNVEEFPNYLQIIGGEENMMDISTMQRKNDDGEYSSMDEVKVRGILNSRVVLY